MIAWATIQATAMWRVLGLIVFPVGFSIEHEAERVPVILQDVLLAMWLVLPVALWRQRIPRKVFVGVLWFWIALAPRLVVVLPFGAYLSERHVYTAFVGLALAGAALVQ